MGQVVEINISKKKGTIKTPIHKGELIADFGLEGDAHGGKWHRQVSILAEESIEKMKRLGLLDLEPGVFAENITTKGIELHSLPIGTILKIGESLTEVTQIGKHCHKHCEIYHKVGSCIMPTEGIFVKVLKGGCVKAGDEITIMGEAQND